MCALCRRLVLIITVVVGVGLAQVAVVLLLRIANYIREHRYQGDPWSLPAMLVPPSLLLSVVALTVLPASNMAGQLLGVYILNGGDVRASKCMLSILALAYVFVYVGALTWALLKIGGRAWEMGVIFGSFGMLQDHAPTSPPALDCAARRASDALESITTCGGLQNSDGDNDFGRWTPLQSTRSGMPPARKPSTAVASGLEEPARARHMCSTNEYSLPACIDKCRVSGAASTAAVSAGHQNSCARVSADSDAARGQRRHENPGSTTPTAGSVAGLQAADIIASQSGFQNSESNPSACSLHADLEALVQLGKELGAIQPERDATQHVSRLSMLLMECAQEAVHDNAPSGARTHDVLKPHACFTANQRRHSAGGAPASRLQTTDMPGAHTDSKPTPNEHAVACSVWEEEQRINPLGDQMMHQSCNGFAPEPSQALSFTQRVSSGLGAAMRKCLLGAARWPMRRASCASAPMPAPSEAAGASVNQEYGFIWSPAAGDVFVPVPLGKDSVTVQVASAPVSPRMCLTDQQA